MVYAIEFLPRAKEDLRTLKYIGNKSAYRKVNSLIDELKEHPATGTGHPEQLKHELSGYWSRHIDKKNRLIYRIEENIVTVVVASALGHY